MLTVGELLDQVDGDFDDWVLENLPMSVRAAERIRAMYHLHRFKPDCPELPAAWKALWCLPD